MKIEDAVPADVLECAAKVVGMIDFLGMHPERLGEANLLLRRMVGKMPLADHGGFYTMRLLTAEGADYFLGAADRLADQFQPNAEEGREYQIPEIVMAHHGALAPHYLLARQIGEQILWPLFHLMYGNPPNVFSSIQLARYSAPSNLGTGWHCDTDSEATCVVSLAPERHQGGGTELMPKGAFAPAEFLPPLPKGHALLFNGRCTLHRGVELDSGERNLLVYWMTNIS